MPECSEEKCGAVTKDVISSSVKHTGDYFFVPKETYFLLLPSLVGATEKAVYQKAVSFIREQVGVDIAVSTAGYLSTQSGTATDHLMVVPFYQTQNDVPLRFLSRGEWHTRKICGLHH